MTIIESVDTFTDNVVVDCTIAQMEIAEILNYLYLEIRTKAELKRSLQRNGLDVIY